MTEKELRKKCGLEPGELVNTNLGALDIFAVKDNFVQYGFLSGANGGKVLSESVKSFLEKIGKS